MGARNVNPNFYVKLIDGRLSYCQTNVKGKTFGAVPDLSHVWLTRFEPDDKKPNNSAKDRPAEAAAHS
jgi:hypothetical protein